MRTIIFAMIIAVFSNVSQASVEVCSSHIKSDPKKLAAVEFLKSVEGQYNVGYCKVEIHACREFSESNDRGDSIGDVLVTDINGKEFYTQIILPEVTSPKIHTKWQVSDKMFHYELRDVVPDKYNGLTEWYHLEILKMAGPKPTTVELGTFSTKEAWSHMSRYTFVWAVCNER